jgi:hypothetical protein
MRRKLTLYVISGIVALVVISGIGAIPSLRGRMLHMQEESENWARKVDQLRAFETTLTDLESRALGYHWISELGDELAEEILIRDLLECLLRRCALEGEIVLDEKTESDLFPSYVNIREYKGELGIREYDEYGQLIDFFEALKNTSVAITAFHVAGDEADMKVSGLIRLKFRVFLTPRSAL